MSIFDDLLGNTASNASNSAAADTFAKQKAATAGLRTAGSDYAAGMAEQGAKFQPYEQAGGSALNQLMAGLGLGGNSADFTAGYHNLPGYQSGLDTGTKATAAALNAGNVDQSGKALKTLYRYGSDYENQRAGDYLTRLSGVAGAGQQATGQDAQITGQGLTGQLGAETSAYGGDMTAAGTIGQGEVAGANAKQSALTNLMQTGAYLGGAALTGGASLAIPRFSGTQVNAGAPGGGYYGGSGNTLYPGPGQYGR